MNLLITRMLNVFGEPDSPDPKAYIDELELAMRGTSDKLLRAAGDRVMRTHRGRSFPTIGVIMAAIDEERNASQIGTVPSNDWMRFMPRVQVADYDEATKERWRKADEFQKAMAAKYGSFDEFLTKTVNIRPDDTGKGAKLASKRSSFKTLSELSRRMAGDA